MRVLHVNSSARIGGGVEVYLRDLFDGLAAAGVEARLAFGMGDGTEFPGSAFVSELNDPRIFSRRDGGFRAVKAVIAEFRPDVIHVHALSNQNALSACLDSAPTFLHLHDYRYLCPASSFHFRATESNCSLNAGAHCIVRGCVSHCVSRRPDVSVPALQRVRWTMARFDRFAAIFANSRHVHSRLLAAGGPASTSTVLHYFCSYSAPASLPVPSSPPYVLFVGRLAPLKGTGDFVRCVSRLAPSVRGVIVGEGTAVDEGVIHGAAREAGCSDRISLVPWKSREEVARIISGAVATVFPSVWEEPFGLVGLESQVLGVPVVGYGHGGVTDWLQDGVTGLSVPPRDVDGLAAAVTRIMGDPDLRMRLVQQAAARAASEFSRELHLERLVSHYRAAIGRPD
jgi:glycosyltransferase involved in cell wall biosynthesis